MDPLPILLPLFLVPGIETIEPAFLYTDGEAVMMDSTVGTGAVAGNGDVVSVHYVLREMGGKEIANSVLRGLPFSFVLDDKSLLGDFVKGMHVGGLREVTLPAERLGMPELIGPKVGTCSLSLRLLTVRHPAPQPK